MNKLLAILLSCLVSSAFAYNAGTTTWKPVKGTVPSNGERLLVPNKYQVFALHTQSLKNTLAALPTDPASAVVMSFPTPDGDFRNYKIWQTPVMHPELAAKYPGIRTFTGYAVDNPAATFKLDYTQYGVHAMINNGGNTYFIDPYSSQDDGYYICYFKRDYERAAYTLMPCEVSDDTREIKEGATYLTPTGTPNIKYKTHGTVKRTYRLALACTGEYAVAVDGPNPTKAGVLSKIITSLNRINGVFEKELAVTMELVPNNDDIIFLQPGYNAQHNPYSNSSGGSMLGQNKIVCDSKIGISNYDMGHVFSTGGGGVAILASVCNSSDKAKGVTGQPNPVGDPFDIDFVAHEMGHQFGADHSFNSNEGGCASHSEQSEAYEPGSGSTLMGYASLCGGDNLQAHSDDYFHAKSLDVISTYITTGGGTCGAAAPVVNVPPVVPSFTQSYNIPYRTPFELTAPSAIDVDHDVLTYCWEQWNLGDWKQNWANTNHNGPIFRSLLPTASPTRVFPRIDSLVKNVSSYVGEKLPNTDRSLKFKLTVRDVLNGIGTYNFADDSIMLNVVNTGAPFEVTHPNTNINWTSGNAETITWQVSNTSVAPINCSHVDIFLSTDGGYTYPVQLASNTPNDGSETIMVPALPIINKARVKVKGSGNVFFDISNSNFAINDPSNVREIAWQNAVKVYPIPANDVLYISNDYKKTLTLKVVNALGQKVYDGEVVKRASIQVGNWARGVYYIRFAETESGEGITRTIVVN